jgi:hypothetical protein
VLQLSANGLLAGAPTGKLVKVARDGTRTELAPGQLTMPTGLAVARNGDVYVANNGTSGSAPEIVRIVADPGNRAGGGRGDD